MPDDSRPRFTPRQGQYLAFIHAYTLVIGRPPAEADMQRFFRVSGPAVHQMLVYPSAGESGLPAFPKYCNRRRIWCDESRFLLRLSITLANAGLISRRAGMPRSVRVLVDLDVLPKLQPTSDQPVKTSVQGY